MQIRGLRDFLNAMSVSSRDCSRNYGGKTKIWHATSELQNFLSKHVVYAVTQTHKSFDGGGAYACVHMRRFETVEV